MPCFSPLKAWRSRTLSANGKYGIIFDAVKAKRAGFQSLELPCGQCIGCRLERSRQWAIRCLHEASMYADNCFITLTYDDAHLPEDRSLNVRHFQLFMKRLRKKFGAKIRFYHCGEYGEQFGRPHYHACLFNFDFPDKELWKVANGNRIYTSKTLSDLWSSDVTGGFCTIGDVTFESAAYVARYVMKKITGDRAQEHYVFIDETTGEFFRRAAEYTTMSRRPGIGRPWLDRYCASVFPEDFVVVRGVKMKPPKFYDRQFEIQSPKVAEKIKRRRMSKALKRKSDNTPERLRVREKVTRARVKRLKREVD